MTRSPPFARQGPGLFLVLARVVELVDTRGSGPRSER
jgi:hypothetical protein